MKCDIYFYSDNHCLFSAKRQIKFSNINFRILQWSPRRFIIASCFIINMSCTWDNLFWRYLKWLRTEIILKIKSHISVQNKPKLYLRTCFQEHNVSNYVARWPLIFSKGQGGCYSVIKSNTKQAKIMTNCKIPSLALVKD